jgi:predicted metal-binding protein
MREAEVGLPSKSAAWCGKSKSRGIALRSITETRQKNLEQVSRSWTTRRDVRLADRDAVKFLRDCEADGMMLENCPEYVREWMDREED